MSKHTVTSDFETALFAGGEHPGGAATATPPAPAAPEAPAAQPAQQPAGGQPAAPADPGAAQQPAEGQAPAAEMPQYAQDLFSRMDQLLPPAQVDPLAVELGLVPAPAQPLPGQQGYDPSQQFGQPAGPGQPGALPQQPQALPGQPQTPDPGQGAVDPQTEIVERYIEQRANEAAEKLIGEKVTPLFQQQEAARRRAESQSLLDDYGELKDPAKSQALVAQARAWAGETLGDPRFAAEPGYLETVHLAMKGLELGQLVQEGKITLPEGVSAPLAAAAAPGVQPGSGEVPIEGPGGAQPGSPTPESTQRAQAIVDAGPAGGLNSLWV